MDSIFVEMYIKPIGLYNSENWATLSEHKINSISANKTRLLDYIMESEPDSVAKFFQKFILGVNKNTPTMGIIGESGQVPLYLQGFISLLKLWFRNTHMSGETLANKAYKAQLSGEKQSDWLSTVHFLLKYIGMEGTQCSNVFDASSFEKECKKKLIQKFTDEWKCKLKNDGRLKFYDQIKHIYAKEKYLDDVKDYKTRKMITKFRCSDHKLEIEIGRHNGTPPDERICKLCHDEIENEIHFLCVCPTYADLRKRIFNQEKVDMKLAKKIIACQQKTLSLKLGNYLQKAFKIRESVLEAVNEHERMLKDLLRMGYIVVN